MYQKGQDKKEEIYSNSKVLFYNEGYNNTTVKDIAGMSNCPVSLVHYYFNKKDNILSDIYYEFQTGVDAFIAENVPEAVDDILLLHTLNNRIYYDIILRDPQNSRVYYEHLQRQSNYRVVNKYAYETYDKYLKQYDIVISKELYKAYIIMNFGARRECFLEYFKGELKLDAQHMVSEIMGLFPRLLKLDQDYIDSKLLLSLSIFKKLDFASIYSSLKFLI
ncbi:transcriptional regulator, TetR family [Sporobacter termitidis DSM 10068]|uniref:Transcriptional regulator, TetR family n=2 Tax=Sporobacter TaxID=44748 RepID=A0A1M5T9M3_9FIRM|nr:transcriptional regulator, TetR family [Sporobacter termitidis DSM 10068]